MKKVLLSGLLITALYAAGCRKEKTLPDDQLPESVTSPFAVQFALGTDSIDSRERMREFNWAPDSLTGPGYFIGNEDEKNFKVGSALSFKQKNSSGYDYEVRVSFGLPHRDSVQVKEYKMARADWNNTNPAASKEMVALKISQIKNSEPRRTSQWFTYVPMDDNKNGFLRVTKIEDFTYKGEKRRKISFIVDCNIFELEGTFTNIRKLSGEAIMIF